MAINNNVNTLSAKSLLLDWVSGQGATGKTPETWEHVQDGYLHGKAVSLSLLTAIAEMKSIGTPVSFDTSIADGYLSKNHLDQHETGSKVSGKGEALITTKANITSEQYLNNLIKLGLDNKNQVAISDIVMSYYAITDKTTKAELTDLLKQIVDCFVPADSYKVFRIKEIDEIESAIKFQTLTDNGFTDILPTGKGQYVGNLDLSSLSSLGLLSSIGYQLSGTKLISDNVYQVIFKSDSE
jgi:hypothetical protein